MISDKFSRRGFIKTGSIAVGALALSNSIKAWAVASPAKKKLGIALVGLGYYSSGQLAPALQHTDNCYLAGIVTGTPSKAVDWAKKYNIPKKNIYNYQNFDEIAHNPDIDIVYVVLPVFFAQGIYDKGCKSRQACDMRKAYGAECQGLRRNDCRL